MATTSTWPGVGCHLDPLKSFDSDFDFTEEAGERSEKGRGDSSTTGGNPEWVLGGARMGGKEAELITAVGFHREHTGALTPFPTQRSH